MEEIPHNLLDSYESEENSEREYSTFRNAVSRAKESYAHAASDGYVKPTTGFGANFVAPSKRGLSSSPIKSASNRTATKSFIKKSAINKQREEEKIKAFFADNKIKRMAQERRERIAHEQEEAKKREEERIAAQTVTTVYSVGERVFHAQMGIGHITDVMHLGESVMYTIDFGKLGKKAMDASSAKLKKF